MIDQHLEKERVIVDEKLKQNEETKVYEIFREVMKSYLGVEIEKEKAGRILEFFMTVMYNLTLNPSAIVRGYYLCAEQDYEAAKLLSKKFPSLAVFHLQQTVEKITKAYALHMGLIKEEESYKKRGNKVGTEVVGHISPKAFILLLKKRGAAEFVDTVFLACPEIPKITVKEVLQKFEKLLQKTDELAKLSKNEINHFIKRCEDIQDAIRKIDIRKTRENFKRLKVGFIARLRSAVSPEIVEDIKKKFNAIERKIGSIINELLTFSQLYALAIITFPHFSYSRYPGGKITFADYHEGLGIVDSLDDILISIGSIMKSLEKICARG
ncbi:MAG: hypothetical protein QXX33_05145 [Candidatus Hadarchaeales archaeon]